MARPSAALQPFSFALILAIVGMCTIPAQVQSSSSSWSRGVYHEYLRARIVYEENCIASPRASPLDSRHGSTHDLASRRNMQIAISALSAPISPAAAEMGPQQQPCRQRLYRTPRSAYSMLPRGSVYSPPGPSLGSNSVLPPPDRP